MIKLTKRHIGKPIIAEFTDHTSGATQLMPCKAIGWLLLSDDKKIVICSWDICSKDINERIGNWETYTIIKSAITNITLLK